MILNVTVADEDLAVHVPDRMLSEAEEFFIKMDHDMDRGWRMGRRYVEDPTLMQRCQIAADRLLTALHQDNEHIKLMMAGYILSRMPRVERVVIDHTGNMQDTEFEFRA